MLAKNFRLEMKFDCDERGNIIAYCDDMNRTALFFENECVFPVCDGEHIIPPPQEGAGITIAIPSGTLTGFVGEQWVEKHFRRGDYDEMVPYFTRIVRIDSPQWDGGYNGLLYGFSAVGHWTVDMSEAIVQTSITNTQMPFKIYKSAREFADCTSPYASNRNRENWLNSFRIAARALLIWDNQPAVSKNAFFSDAQEMSEEKNKNNNSLLLSRLSAEEEEKNSEIMALLYATVSKVPPDEWDVQLTRLLSALENNDCDALVIARGSVELISDRLGYIPTELLNGLAIYYQDSGMKWLGTLRNGNPEGVWRQYYRDGSVAYEGWYEKGKRQGLWRRWYENGQLGCEEWYEAGKRQGVWRNWDEKGNLKSEHDYGFDLAL